MDDLPVPRPEIASRLRNIEGQLRGIQQMLANERDCMDILIQLAAVRSGVESAAVMVLKNYTEICMAKEGRDSAADIAKAVAMWVGGSAK